MMIDDKSTVGMIRVRLNVHHPIFAALLREMVEEEIGWPWKRVIYWWRLWRIRRRK